MNDSTSIDVLLDLVINKLKLNEIPHFQKLDRKVWLRSFRNNLIFNLGLLRRVNPSKLQSLKLPLVLEEEFEKIIQASRNREPLVDIAKYLIEDLESSVHTEAQETIQNRSLRYLLKLTDQQKELVRSTWQLVALQHDRIDEASSRFSKIFYPIFFQLNPTGQRLFEGSNLVDQSKALTNMLNWIVNNMDNLSNLVAVVGQMGGRHEIYGVNEEDYQSFASALGKTLKTILGAQIADEAVKAWEDTLMEIARMMIEEGKKVKLGYRGELLRERSNGAWAKCWVSLSLTSLYIFNDEYFTQLKAKYSLHGIDTIAFPKNSLTHSFELESQNPKFTLRFSTDQLSTLEDWIFEIDWRIQAIQRVFANKESVSDESSAAMKNPICRQVKKTNKKIQKKGLNKPDLVTLPEIFMEATDQQKQLVRQSWLAISESKEFFLEFYKNFFKDNPAGRRLFPKTDTEMTVQISALSKMMKLMVHSLDNQEELKNSLQSLGGRHEVYGVDAPDYLSFSESLLKTIQTCLPDSTLETSEAWKCVMLGLASMMFHYGRKMKTQHISGQVYRRLSKDGWKKSTISASLDTLYVFRDEKKQKLRSSYEFQEIGVIEDINPQAEFNEAPTEFGFLLELNTQNNSIYFACDSEETQAYWMQELTWRIQATHRSYKELEEITDSDSHKKSSSGRSKSTRKKKKLTKIT
eukprot:TRINITY_DN2757_c0_g1_i1.p1 TRINITY_DN2757_c0_g1~~TRINITY_DN2757_c0_g1_i1.p1  ORF type:complete len:691 (+),score=183.29 TRINITY_DN2757_c0_g1_i1:110-2182(+)